MKLNDSGVVFTPEPRGYFLGKKQLSGITGLIREKIFPEMYGDVPEHILRNAAERGTRIHEETQAYDLFGAGESEETQWYADAMVDVEVLATEYIVTDFNHYASPIDKIIRIGDKIYLADLKTTYKLDAEYLRWQLGVLLLLFSIVNPEIKIDGCKAIWIDRKNKRCDIVDIEPIERAIISDLLASGVSGEPFTNPFAKVVKTDNNKLVLALVRQIAEIAAEVKSLNELKKEYEDGIKKIFDAAGVDKWESDYFIITRVAPYERKGFDSKGLQGAYPEIYKEFETVTTVGESIRTKLK